MNKLFAILALTAAASGILGYVLWKRFGSGGKAGDETKDESGKTRTKKEHKDFTKSKAGLIRHSTLTEGAEISATASPTPLGEYVTLRDGVLRKWTGTKLDVEWEELTLAEAFADLGTRHGLDARLDPSVTSRTLTFKVSDLPAIEALELLTNMANLAWVVNMAGELWIFPKDRTSTYAPPAYLDFTMLADARRSFLADRTASGGEPELARKLRETGIAGRGVAATDLYGFLNFLSQVTEVNYVLKPTDDPPQLPALTPADGESIDAFLRRALEPVGYTFTVTQDSVILLTKEDAEAEAKEAVAREAERKGRIEAEAEFFRRPVAVGGDQLSLPVLAEELGRALNVPVFVDPTSARRAAWYSFNAIEQPAAEVVKIMKKGAPLEVTYRDGKLWFLAPEDLHN